jgi:hypothetical protein
MTTRGASEIRTLEGGNVGGERRVFNGLESAPKQQSVTAAFSTTSNS